MTMTKKKPAHHVFATILMNGVMALAGAVILTPMAQAADKVKVAAASSAPLVKVDKAWIRATVPGQSGTGGFMDLTASRALTLVGFSSSVASESELHEMAMDGGVMRMHPVDALPLPAGQTVSLSPGAGGHHLMMMGLKRQLKDGEEITLKLKLRTADGKSLTQEVKVPVKSGATGGTKAMHDGM